MPARPHHSCPRATPRIPPECGAGLAACLALLLAACASPRGSQPPLPQPPATGREAEASIDAGQQLALLARAQLGIPYRYGGDGPGGFDCSGLVLYVHRQFGLALPRSAFAQHAAATPVARDALAPGDLVFFRFAGERIDHVGLYVGAGRFVHAPKAGAPVVEVPLDAPWFSARFAGAGRYWR